MPDPYPPRLLVGIAAGEWWDAQDGLTAVDVADRMREYGDAPSSATMSRLKNGREGVSIDRWLTLALALRVPPLALLFPPDEPDEGREGIEVAPGVVMSPRWAWAWATGEEDPPAIEGVTGAERWKSDWRERERSARLVRDRQEALDAWHRAVVELNSVEAWDQTLEYDRWAKRSGEPAFSEFDPETGKGVDTSALSESNMARGLVAAATLQRASDRLEALGVPLPHLPPETEETLDLYIRTKPEKLAQAKWELQLGDALWKVREATAELSRAQQEVERVRQEQP